MRGLAFGVTVLIVGAAGCADEVECPEGRDKVGN
jgi:hypothetical protein